MARRSFVDTLRDVRGGQVLEDMDAKLQELVRAVQETGAAGELVLKVSVAPMKGSNEAVVVKDDIKQKLPVIKSAGTVLFPTPEGNLQRSHYRQDDLPGITLAAQRTG
jgi:hypothetical protein